MALKNYTITEFRWEFEPEGKLALIICKLVNSSNSTWQLEIRQFTDDEGKQLSLYEKAEAIKDAFTQEYHDVKEIFCDINGRKLTLFPRKTVNDILIQIATQIYP